MRYSLRKSTALLFGARVRDWILGFYSAAFALILAAGFAEHAGWPFAFVMLAAGAHLLWQVQALAADVNRPYPARRKWSAGCADEQLSETLVHFKVSLFRCWRVLSEGALCAGLSNRALLSLYASLDLMSIRAELLAGEIV